MIPMISPTLTNIVNFTTLPNLTLFTSFIVFIFILVKLITILYRFHIFNKLPHDDQSHWLLGDVIRLMPTFPFTPGPDETPLRDAVNYYQEKFKDKSVFVVWLTWFPVVICKDYRSAQLFLGNRNNLEKGWFYNFLDPRFKNGLIGATLDKWSKRRKLVLPALNRRAMENFVPIVVNSCHSLINDLTSTSSCPIDIKDPIYLATFNIICQLVMGVQVLPSKASFSSSSSSIPLSSLSSVKFPSLIEAITSFTKPIMSRVVNPLFRLDWLFHCTSLGKTYRHHVNIFNTFSNQAITNRLKTIQSTRPHSVNHRPSDLEQTFSGLEYNSMRKSTTKSILDYLLTIYLDNKDSLESQSSSFKLKSHHSIDIKGIKEELDNTLAAGYETTAIAIMWTIYLLGLNPEIQRKAYEDVLDLPLDESDSSTLTLDHFNGLTYLDQCVKESIRLIPPLPMIARKLDSDVVCEGVKIPAGSTVGIMIHMIHRDENIFPNPNVYNPDRFNPERLTSIPACGFIPFSMGPRNCIGQKFAYLEIKIVLAFILKHFTIISTEPMDKITYEHEMITSPKVPLNVKFISRETHIH
ncbi:cytochrome P450 4C1-like [Tetranychus urticae]|nr:cytochrome P450 4C1-like [Tetranychus urticae]